MKRNLLVLSILLAFSIVFYDWIKGTNLSSGFFNSWHRLSNLSGMFGFILMFYLFVFSAKIRLIEENIGLDKMIKIHKNIGTGVVAFLFLHFILMITYDLQVMQEPSADLARLLGLIALFSMLIMVSTAKYYKKLKMKYETWKFIHYLNYIVFPVALVHVFISSSSNAPSYYLWVVFAICFAIIVISRIYGLLIARQNPYTLVNVKQENQSIWTLEFEGKPISHIPGQFLYIQFANRHHLLQSHPFTISSSPTYEKIHITPKELGDFTSQIKNLRVGEKAFIDGPYGVFSYKLCDDQNLVFIAGGIGITPFISMLRYMYDKKDIHKNVLLFWGNKSEKELVFQEELAIYENELANFKKVLVMSEQKDWQGEQGRINKELLLKYINEPKDYTYFICGPIALQQSVKKDLKEMGVDSRRIIVESFEL